MFKVASKCCNECLFSKNKIVSDGRKTEVLADCARNDAHFICHKATIKGEDICCKGFYDRDPAASNLMRIAGRMRMVEFVDIGGDKG